MIPGPRPPKGHDRPSASRDRGRDILRPLPSAELAGHAPEDGSAAGRGAVETPSVVLARTRRGWSVVSPVGPEPVDDLVEGMSLADLVAEEFGSLAEPDRSARRSARGPVGATQDAEDPVDARVAALERTVAQLEHALAARVSTERAIGVLAERHGITPRAAFESLRRDARSQGRPVPELAREVLDSLAREPEAEAGPFPEGVVAVTAPAPGPATSESPALAVADGRS